MELDKFIENTILDIMNGVAGAQEKCPARAMVNPPVANGGMIKSVKQVVNVGFDIEVGEINEGETKGKVGVALSLLKIGGDKTNRDTERSVNRITFSIPIVLPHREEDEELYDSSARRSTNYY